MSSSAGTKPASKARLSFRIGDGARGVLGGGGGIDLRKGGGFGWLNGLELEEVVRVLELFGMLEGAYGKQRLVD